jgi:hypothetical protein
MTGGTRLFAGVIGLAAGPVIASFFPGTTGMVLLVVALLFACAMLGSLVLSLGFDVTKWRDDGYFAGTILGVITFALVTVIFGKGIWDRVDFEGIVSGTMNGNPSPGLGAFLVPAAWNSGLLLIGMLVVSSPVLAISKLLSGPHKPATKSPPAVPGQPPAS